MTEDEYNNQIELEELALESWQQCTNIFNKIQSNHCKKTCECCTWAHHNLVMASFQNSGNIVSIPSISKSIATLDIILKYETITSQASAAWLPYPLLLHNNTSVSSSDIINMKNWDRIFSSTRYIQALLRLICSSSASCIIAPSNKYYLPFNMATVLHKHCSEKFKFKKKRISVRSSILTFIRNEVVPVSQSTLYKTLDLYKADSLNSTDTWTEPSTQLSQMFILKVKAVAQYHCLW